jgi:cytochrome b561
MNSKKYYRQHQYNFGRVSFSFEGAQMQTTSKYPLSLRLVHWITVLLLLALVVLGFWMTDRSAANIWDALTNTLYAWHKALGFAALLIVGLRLAIRARTQTVPDSAPLPQIQRKLIRLVHASLYLLLLAMPLFGWAGVTAFPALITLGGYHLPAMPGVPVDQVLAKQLLGIHGTLAIVLIVLALVHILAGLKHLLIDKDGIFNKIWFGNPS